MAVTLDKTVKITTKGLEKESLLGDIKESKSNKPASKKDVSKIISEIKKGFNKFVQEQITYAESSASKVSGSFDADNFEIGSSGGGNEQLERIESNTNTIISQLSKGGGGTSSPIGAIGKVAKVAFPALGVISTLFGAGGGGFIKHIGNAIKSAFKMIFGSPTFIFTASVIFATLYRYLLKPAIDPIAKFFKSNFFDGIKEKIDKVISFFKDPQSLEKIQNAIQPVFDYFSTHSLDEIFTDIKGMINKVLNKLGIDIMGKEREDAAKNAERLAEESSKIKAALDDNQKRLDEAIKVGAGDEVIEALERQREEIKAKQQKNSDDTKKLADNVVKNNLDDTSWAKKFTESSYEAERRLELKKLALANNTTMTEEEKKAELAKLERSVKVKGKLEDGGEVVGNAIGWVMGKLESINSKKLPRKERMAGNSGMTVKEVSDIRSKLKQDDTPSRLQFDGRNIGNVRINENELKESVDYIRKAMPDMWKETLANISSNPNNAGKDSSEIEHEASKVAMEQYLNGVKQLFDDFNKGRAKDNEELKKIFSDGKVSKEEIINYMKIKDNIKRDTQVKPVTVIVKGGHDDKRNIK